MSTPKEPLRTLDAFGDPDTTIVYETRDGGGGEASDPPNTDININAAFQPELEMTIDPAPPVHRGGGGRVARPPKPAPAPTPPPPPVEAAPAEEPAVPDPQERLKNGKASPEEALAYFQQHGFPDLKTPPTFVNGAWLIPVGAPGSAPQVGNVDSVVIHIVAGPPAPIETSQPPTPAEPRPPRTPAPAPGASRPSPPVPGSTEADRQKGFAIGQIHGEFRAWTESFMSLLQDPHGGVSAWDNMSPRERTAAIDQMQAKYNGLPRLPAGVDPAHDSALKQGFEQGAAISYSAARWENRAVWVAAELAKEWAKASAALPTPVMVGSAFSDRFSDCAAQTASQVLENSGNAGVTAGFLQRNFGLPRVAISSYKDAVAYAKNWFTAVGLELAPKPGGFAAIAEGGTAGNYVVFFEGGASGGHVAYGAVTADGVRIVDRQLGQTWNSVQAAQKALGMRATSTYRVINVNVP